MGQKNKVFSLVDAAVADIPDGATIMFGGFGGAGFPNNLIQGLARQGARNLKVISNNCGTGDGELGFLFKNRQISRVVAAFRGRARNISTNNSTPARLNSNWSRRGFSVSECALSAPEFRRFIRR
jgi:acyl CoA:acetate/3-ketoacid CoA transferase alpha subunit